MSMGFLLALAFSLSPQMGECPVHQVLLLEGTVRVVYGCNRGYPEFDRAAARHFPHSSGLSYGGFPPTPIREATVQYCPRCREAEAEWRSRVHADAMRKARRLYKFGLYARAERQLYRALMAAFRDVQAHLLLADVYEKQGNTRAAISHHNAAIAFALDEHPYVSFVRLYLRTGDCKRACDVFQHGFQRFPALGSDSSLRLELADECKECPP